MVVGTRQSFELFRQIAWFLWFHFINLNHEGLYVSMVTTSIIIVLQQCIQCIILPTKTYLLKLDCYAIELDC